MFPLCRKSCIDLQALNTALFKLIRRKHFTEMISLLVSKVAVGFTFHDTGVYCQQVERDMLNENVKELTAHTARRNPTTAHRMKQGRRGGGKGEINDRKNIRRVHEEKTVTQNLVTGKNTQIIRTP